MFGLTLWATAPSAETPIDLAPCLEILSVMPEDMIAFEVLSCRGPGGAQTRAELLMSVPPEQVVALADRLTNDYGMGKLIFLCCGYEPQGGLSADIELTDGRVTPGPPGAYTFLTMSMSAPGLSPDGTSGTTEFLGLGDVAALLQLTIVDI